MRPWEEMQAPERFDYIVVVGGLLHQGQRVPANVYAFLEAAAEAGVPLVGLCTGSFVLTRAGLLNGYVTCVSWFHREDFTREFPRLRLVTNQMYMVDRDRMTCAGGTSVVHLEILSRVVYGDLIGGEFLSVLLQHFDSVSELNTGDDLRDHLGAT